MTSSIKKSKTESYFNLLRELYLNEENRDIRKVVISYMDIVARGYIFINHFHRCFMCYKRKTIDCLNELRCWYDEEIGCDESRYVCKICLDEHESIYDTREIQEDFEIYKHVCNFGSYVEAITKKIY